MDTKKVFRGISRKMLEDFRISSEINHSGSKGVYRENALKNFLSEGRFPKRFAIGSGEIVSPAFNVSKQSDLIIFDQHNGYSLIYDENTQVYPVECVAGTIEVKSTLNKTEFIKSLNNIKSVKELGIKGKLAIPSMRKISEIVQFVPFGAIFGYQLGQNSLESLEENLMEWKQSNPPEFWPNVIAVLDKGLIKHNKYGSFDEAITNQSLLEKTYSSGIHFEKDTLFQFYSVVMDLCNSRRFHRVNLSEYYDQSEIVGSLLVNGHDCITKKEDENVYKLTEKFINKVYSICQQIGGITYEESLLQMFGEIPLGVDKEELPILVYIYNPGNLKGTHEVDEKISAENGIPDGLIVPYELLKINGETYFVPRHYISNNEVEIIKGKRKSDI